MARSLSFLLFMLIPVIALAIPGVRADSLFAQTSGSVSADLMVRESGPDFQLCWLPSVATGKPPVYLVFLRPPGESSWFYFDYTENTCFVHYGASLFYPGMNYEVHAYFGSVRDLPGYPRDPQDPRLPGEAIRSFWEPPLFDPQGR